MKISALKFVWVIPFLITGLPPATRAADGQVNLKFSGTSVLLRVNGDKDDDWRMQSSTNFTTWTTLTNFGVLLSGNETNAPWRSAGGQANGPV